jgi:hypothetical protein
MILSANDLKNTWKFGKHIENVMRPIAHMRKEYWEHGENTKILNKFQAHMLPFSILKRWKYGPSWAHVEPSHWIFLVPNVLLLYFHQVLNVFITCSTSSQCVLTLEEKWAFVTSHCIWHLWLNVIKCFELVTCKHSCKWHGFWMKNKK